MAELGAWDGMAVDFFRKVISKELSFGSGRKGQFWDRTVMQTCHAHAAPRQAIIALAQVYRQDSMAPRGYAKALRELVALPEAELIVTLVTDLVMWCVELRRGSFEGTTRHFRHLWAVMGPRAAECPLDLAGELYRLDTFEFFNGQTSREFPSISHYPIDVSTPFTTFEQARAQLDLIVSR